MNSQPHILSLFTSCKANMGSMVFRSLSGIGVLVYIFYMDCAGEMQVKGDEGRGQCGHQRLIIRTTPASLFCVIHAPITSTTPHKLCKEYQEDTKYIRTQYIASEQPYIGVYEAA
jgi:hypothetical protein